MNSRELETILDNACADGADYVDSCPDYRTAWDGCDRGDWMIWVADYADVDRRKLASAVHECVNTVSHLMLCQSSIDALQGLRRYADGEIGEEQLEVLGEAAWDDPRIMRIMRASDRAAADAAIMSFGDALLGAAQAAEGSVTDALSIFADIIRAHISFDDIKINC